MTLKHLVCSALLFAALMLAGSAGSVFAAGSDASAANGTAQITGIQWQQKAGTFQLTVQGSEPPTYTMYELFTPLRLVVDIAGATLADSVTLPMEINSGPVAKVDSRLLDDQEPQITRIEVFLAEDSGYAVERAGNDIVITFAEGAETAAAGSNGDMASTDAEMSTATMMLSNISVTQKETETEILLAADGPILSYKEAKLPKGKDRPDRLYIDLAGVSLGAVPQQLAVGGAVERIRTAKRDNGVRVVIDSGLDRLFNYRIEPHPAGLKVIIDDAGISTAAAPAIAASQPADRIVAPEPSAADTTVVSHPAREAKTVPDEFSLSGYDTQRITVDFFKIDLHNVFRLLGEISGRNIVIDEGVGGSLTLALNDVPWDFVLDVVLNLKELQKEERYNTIVISPKNKEFTWPERAAANLAIKAEEGGVAPMEAISIKKRLETPPEVIEAKKLIKQAQDIAKTDDYSAALPIFEEAYAKWPDNGQLAKRIAGICLVQLGLNAKAVHYAKAALKVDPHDYDAALQAAIGLANMKMNEAATEYFDLAVSAPQPSSEALTSYAAFSEEQQNYVATLLLLSKHAALYGDSLETMIAKARIYDKQGNEEEALQEYRAILLSGYDIPADLRRYIKARLAAAAQ